MAQPAFVGPYRVLRPLGTGGMGSVFLARGPDGANVAVKVIRPELAADADFLARFRAEVAAARRVAAFCTARVLDADLDGPLPYLVTEFIDGPRLDEGIARWGPLRDSNLEGFAVGVAAALTSIHAVGLVHRDLKPANVLLSPFGPRVIDFGIARALDVTAGRTQRGLVLGTPGWMAPEQLAGHPVTPAADVFVWGALVRYAAGGALPEIPTGPPARRAAVVADLDRQGLGRLVADALQPDPRQRPSARELLLALLGGRPSDPDRAATEVLERTWVLQRAPTAAAVAPSVPRWPAPRPAPAHRRRWYRRKRVLLPVAALALLGLASAASETAGSGAGLNQAVRDGRLEFVVSSVSCGQQRLGGDLVGRDAQGQFCLVDVSVRNVGAEAQTLHSGSQTLHDAAGNTYRTDGGAVFLVDNALGWWTDLNPGNGVQGILIYDVPLGVDPASVELHDSPLSGGVTVEV